jgi:hypothetical protein
MCTTTTSLVISLFEMMINNDELMMNHDEFGDLSP